MPMKVIYFIAWKGLSAEMRLASKHLIFIGTFVFSEYYMAAVMQFINTTIQQKIKQTKINKFE